MAGSFSLVEKLAVAGAFCAIVVLAVGTEEDPGVIVTGQSDARDAASSAGRERPRENSSNYWARSGDSPESNVTLSPTPPLRENLPPGFGATPSPDLPK